MLAEIESAGTLKAVIAEGLGATILPESMAREVAATCPAWISRLVEPEIMAPLALCQSDHLPLSEPAQAIHDILLELVSELPGNLLGGLRHEELRRAISRPYRNREKRSWRAANGACYRLLDPDHWRAADAMSRNGAHHIKMLIGAMAASDLAELQC